MLYRRLPERVSPFVRSISSRAFNALTELARSVRGMHGAGGLAVIHGGGGVTLWQRRRPLRRRGERSPLMLVKVVLTGGDAGSEVSPCTYVYDVLDEAGNVLAEQVTPQFPRRTTVGKYLPAPDMSWALAFWEAPQNPEDEPRLVLLCVQEVEEVMPCQP